MKDEMCVCAHPSSDHREPADPRDYDRQILSYLPTYAKIGGCSRCDCDDTCETGPRVPFRTDDWRFKPCTALVAIANGHKVAGHTPLVDTLNAFTCECGTNVRAVVGYNGRVRLSIGSKSRVAVAS